MRKKYTVLTVRIEQTKHNLKVIKAFNTLVSNSKTTKGACFVEVVYQYFLMKQEKKLSFVKKMIKKYKLRGKKTHKL
jgi:hypothetical protein